MSCGLLPDHEVSCYTCGETSACTLTEIHSTPSGPFESIYAGYDRACGLRPDRTLACWDLEGAVVAPSGTFRSVSMDAGSSYACGVSDQDGSIICWGDENRFNPPPSGVYESVVLGEEYGCALAAGGEVTCWGEEEAYFAFDPPDVRFSSIDAGMFHVCGMTVDGEPLCWGIDRHGETSIPGGTFKDVAGLTNVCALGSDGTVKCFGPDYRGRSVGPTGTFERLWSSVQFCGERVDRTTACWGGDDGLRTLDGTWDDLASGIGIRDNGALRLFVSFNQSNVPSGTFLSIATARNSACAVRSDASVVCWDHQSFGLATDTIKYLDLTSDHFTRLWARADIYNGRTDAYCGTTPDGTLACFGPGAPSLAPVPAGVFNFVSMGQGHSCALRPDSTAVCWGGNNFSGELDVPAEPLQAVLAGDDYTCAVSMDDELSCWGVMVR